MAFARCYLHVHASKISRRADNPQPIFSTEPHT